MEPGSQTLVDRARAGDRGALEALVVAHLPALRAFVRAKAGRELRELESCSDLVQSACREALADLSAVEYRGDAAFRHWLYTAAERKVLDRARFHARERRDAGRREELDPDSLVRCYASFCTPSEHAIAAEERERIERALDALPATYRDVLRLRCVVGMSNEEIAQELGRTSDYVRMLVARARAKLGARLSDAG